ncbi:hypothetical protein [Deinococcus multiflagellatus]|uniref:Uncharacterized protein n=1 Tax=Deinococcus multiflagellatus TaxID=1656887 RepID=A0ABW1ZJZ1_9DEIO|nr:hypothetical protein [Deinococcus multiflagellatus]MBZ9712458.1 hypothetical protein [Deinococcus multiflagellatus]
MNARTGQDWTETLAARHEEARRARWTRLRWPALRLPRWEITLTVRRLA